MAKSKNDNAIVVDPVGSAANHGNTAAENQNSTQGGKLYKMAESKNLDEAIVADPDGSAAGHGSTASGNHNRQQQKQTHKSYGKISWAEQQAIDRDAVHVCNEPPYNDERSEGLNLAQAGGGPPDTTPSQHGSGGDRRKYNEKTSEGLTLAQAGGGPPATTPSQHGSGGGRRNYNGGVPPVTTPSQHGNGSGGRDYSKVVCRQPDCGQTGHFANSTQCPIRQKEMAKAAKFDKLKAKLEEHKKATISVDVRPLMFLLFADDSDYDYWHDNESSGDDTDRSTADNKNDNNDIGNDDADITDDEAGNIDDRNNDDTVGASGNTDADVGAPTDTVGAPPNNKGAPPGFHDADSIETYANIHKADPSGSAASQGSTTKGNHNSKRTKKDPNGFATTHDDTASVNSGRQRNDCDADDVDDHNNDDIVGANGTTKLNYNAGAHTETVGAPPTIVETFCRPGFHDAGTIEDDADDVDDYNDGDDPDGAIAGANGNTEYNVVSPEHVGAYIRPAPRVLLPENVGAYSRPALRPGNVGAYDNNDGSDIDNDDADITDDDDDDVDDHDNDDIVGAKGNIEPDANARAPIETVLHDADTIEYNADDTDDHNDDDCDYHDGTIVGANEHTASDAAPHGKVGASRGPVLRIRKNVDYNDRDAENDIKTIGCNNTVKSVPWSEQNNTKHNMLHTKEAVEDNICYQDNESSIKLEKNGKRSSSKRTRHIAIRYYFLTDRVSSNEVSIEYCPTEDMIGDYHCPTEDMIGDYHTKSLQGSQSRRFRNAILGIDEIDIAKYDTDARAILKKKKEKLLTAK